ncbi:hypothetical protein AB0E27_20135 [Streptomyces sparsogenes]|uniref:hypothetical protein n=1 Tax=Streptomyces sparsogenes TaxID=67365 RepID=UPI0033DE3706
MRLPSLRRGRPAPSITPGAALDAKTRTPTIEDCREDFVLGVPLRAAFDARARARAARGSG